MVRLGYIVLAIILIVYVSSKPDDNSMSVAEFKFKTFQKLRTDTLGTAHKINLLLHESTTFMDESTHVQKGFHYFLQLLGLIIAIEVGFVILRLRNSGHR